MPTKMACITAAWASPFLGKINRDNVIRDRLASLCPRRSKPMNVGVGKDSSATMSVRESPQQSLPAHPWSSDYVDPQKLIRQVKFNDAGLIPAIAQQWDTGEVLMMAWMNEEAIEETMQNGRAVYYSRSRKKLWWKGETSAQIQVLRDLLLDCDGDTILLKVDQVGVACHTGRLSCFYKAFRPPNGDENIISDVLVDPEELYKSKL